MDAISTASSPAQSAQALGEILMYAQEAQIEQATKIAKFAMAVAVSTSGMGENIDISA